MARTFAAKRPCVPMIIVVLLIAMGQPGLAREQVDFPKVKLSNHRVLFDWRIERATPEAIEAAVNAFRGDRSGREPRGDGDADDDGGFLKAYRSFWKTAREAGIERFVVTKPMRVTFGDGGQESLPSYGFVKHGKEVPLQHLQQNLVQAMGKLDSLDSVSMPLFEAFEVHSLSAEWAYLTHPLRLETAGMADNRAFPRADGGA